MPNFIKKLLLFGSMGILVLIFVALLGELIFNKTFQFPQKINYGITFSPTYSEFLGLDYKKVLKDSLDGLRIKDFRIPTYWSYIEKKEGELDFTQVDFMVDEISKREGKILLVVGFRQPRWPECYLPSWAKGLSLEQRKIKILEFVKVTVEKYKDNPNIWGYQIENEPLLPFFGEGCDFPDGRFLIQEIDLVRSLSEKTIVISDSGELGNWIVPMQASDIFGTTLYRDVYNPILGYLRYPIAPYLYNLKSQVVKKFAPSNQKTIIVELQAEPWIGTENLLNDPKKQTKLFPVEKLKEYIGYGKKTGFDTQYLWGVEWWYWMKENGYPQYWEYTKSLFE